MRLQFVVGALAVVLAVVVVEALRRRRLSEGWAMLWIGVAFSGFLLVLARPLIDRLSASLGIAYGTSLVFAVGIVFLIAVCINLSVQVSRLNRRVEVLAEELALATARPPAGDPDDARLPGAARPPDNDDPVARPPA